MFTLTSSLDEDEKFLFLWKVGGATYCNGDDFDICTNTQNEYYYRMWSTSINRFKNIYGNDHKIWFYKWRLCVSSGEDYDHYSIDSCNTTGFSASIGKSCDSGYKRATTYYTYRIRSFWTSNENNSDGSTV